MSQQQKGNEQIPPVNLQCGHNGQHVIVLFDRSTKALAFTPAQLASHIAHLRQAEAELRAHQEKQRG